MLDCRGKRSDYPPWRKKGPAVPTNGAPRTGRAPMKLLGKTGLLAVQGTYDSLSAFVEHMRVNHRRLYILVTEQFLYRADVVLRIEQMGRERMALRQRRDPILGALAVADQNLAALEIDLLNPEAHDSIKRMPVP